MTLNPLLSGGKQSAFEVENARTAQTFAQLTEYWRHHNSDEWVVNLLADACRCNEFVEKKGPDVSFPFSRQ
jgi:hypothetical protein